METIGNAWGWFWLIFFGFVAMVLTTKLVATLLRIVWITSRGRLFLVTHGEFDQWNLGEWEQCDDKQLFLRAGHFSDSVAPLLYDMVDGEWQRDILELPAAQEHLRRCVTEYKKLLDNPDFIFRDKHIAELRNFVLDLVHMIVELRSTYLRDRNDTITRDALRVKLKDYCSELERKLDYTQNPVAVLKKKFYRYLEPTLTNCPPEDTEKYTRIRGHIDTLEQYYTEVIELLKRSSGQNQVARDRLQQVYVAIGKLELVCLGRPPGTNVSTQLVDTVDDVVARIMNELGVLDHRGAAGLSLVEAPGQLALTADTGGLSEPE